MWRRLAANIRLVPGASVEYVALSAEELQQYVGAGDAEWLQPPWEPVRGQRVVRGVRRLFVVPDAHGRPCSPYEALFDLRHEFDELRQGFLFEICGGADLSLLQDVLGHAEDLGLGEANLDTLFTFCSDTWSVLNQHALVEGPCEDFAERAWPILVECLGDTHRQ